MQEEVLNPEAVAGTQTSVVKSNRTLSYDYDLSGRLTQEKREERQSLRAGGETASTRITSFAYDAVGNRISDIAKQYTGIGSNATLGNTFTQTYTYNDNDWLTQQQGVVTTAAGVTTTYPATSYGYDANGAQTLVTQNDVTTPYEYDFEGKLVRVGNNTSSTRYSYKYDAEGNRLSTTTGTSTGTKTSKFLNDTNTAYALVLESRDEDEALQARYLYGDDYAPLREDWTNADNGTSGTSYYLNDGLSSTRQLADTQGNISDSYAYDAWGNNAGVVGNTPNSFRYNGQSLEGNGLYYLRARFYNAATGRFLNHDPLMGGVHDPVTLHRYLYAGANPMSYVDPGGEEFSVTGLNASMGIANSVQSIKAGIDLQILDGVSNAFGVDMSYEGAAAAIFNKNFGSSLSGEQVRKAEEVAFVAFAALNVTRYVAKRFSKLGESLRNRSSLLNATVAYQKSPGGIRGVELAGDLPQKLTERYGLKHEYVKPGSDMWWRWQYEEKLGLGKSNAQYVSGNDGTGTMYLRPDARKIEVIEEWLHWVQDKSGKIGENQFHELRVNDFMIRHRKILGLSDEDVEIVEQLLAAKASEPEISQWNKGRRY